MNDSVPVSAIDRAMLAAIVLRDWAEDHKDDDYPFSPPVIQLNRYSDSAMVFVKSHSLWTDTLRTLITTADEYGGELGFAAVDVRSELPKVEARLLFMGTAGGGE